MSRKIVVIGDIILDKTTTVSVRGVSPENDAVVVVNQEQIDWNLGGAGNVAANAATLGGDPVLMGFTDHSQVDHLAGQIGLTRCLVRGTGVRTPVKNRVITKQGHYLLRIDDEQWPCGESEEFWNSGGGNIGKAFDAFLHPGNDRPNDQPVVCLVDYDKGCLTKPALSCLMWQIDHVHESFDFPVIVDPGRHGDWKPYGSRRTVFKANLLQASKFCGYGLDHETSTAAYEDAAHLVCRALEERDIPYRAVVLTLGAGGIVMRMCFTREVRHVPVLPIVGMPDVCGAGDTVTAALAVMLARHEKPGTWDAMTAAVINAAKASRIAASQRGVYHVTKGDMGWTT